MPENAKDLFVVIASLVSFKDIRKSSLSDERAVEATVREARLLADTLKPELERLAQGQ
jgi:hypothetical protein